MRPYFGEGEYGIRGQALVQALRAGFCISSSSVAIRILPPQRRSSHMHNYDTIEAKQSASTVLPRVSADGSNNLPQRVTHYDFNRTK